MRTARRKKDPQSELNPASACLGDTLQRLLQTAREAVDEAVTKKDPFAVGRAEVLTQSLHTWANQMETFGVNVQLKELWNDLRDFLDQQGY